MSSAETAACWPLALPCVVDSTSRHTFGAAAESGTLVPVAYDYLGDFRVKS